MKSNTQNTKENTIDQKPTSFTTHFYIEMEVDSFTLNASGKPTQADEVNLAVTYQLRFVRELLNTVSLLSGFAVTSLLTSADEINEYPFDHIAVLESFKILTEFSSKILKNTNFQIKTGELEI